MFSEMVSKYRALRPLRGGRLIAVFALISTPLLPASVEAGDDPSSTAALVARLERLESRVRELEALLEPTATGGDKQGAESQPEAPRSEPDGSAPRFFPSHGLGGGSLHYGETASKLELHAFLDLEYLDTGPDGARAGVSTFDNHHANVFVRSRLRSNLLAHVELEYEHSGDVVEVDQAFMSWRVNPAFTLDAGRFYTPFGIERFVWYSPTNALVSRPAPMRQIVPGNFYANGLKISGTFELGERSLLTYEGSVSDGLGEDALASRRSSRQTRDNNSSRALSGRLAYVWWPKFEIGASYHTQRYASDRDLDLAFFGVDVTARWAGWELRGEYVDAAVEQGYEDTLGSFRRGADLEQAGWYLQAAYAFLWDRELFPGLTLVSRYDQVDQDTSVVGNDDQRSWSLGVNLEVYSGYRVKLEHQWIGEDGEPRDDDALLMQLVIDF